MQHSALVDHLRRCPRLVKVPPHYKYYAAKLFLIPRRVHRIKDGIGLLAHIIWYPDLMQAVNVRSQALELMARSSPLGRLLPIAWHCRVAATSLKEPVIAVEIRFDAVAG